MWTGSGWRSSSPRLAAPAVWSAWRKANSTASISSSPCLASIGEDAGQQGVYFARDFLMDRSNRFFLRTPLLGLFLDGTQPADPFH